MFKDDKEAHPKFLAHQTLRVFTHKAHRPPPDQLLGAKRIYCSVFLCVYPNLGLTSLGSNIVVDFHTVRDKGVLVSNVQLGSHFRFYPESQKFESPRIV